MKVQIFFLTLCFLASACVSTQKPNAELPDYFAKTDGCFLLYNVKTEKFEKVIGEERCRLPLPACSTFKVPLAVIAFDSGVLKDENTVLKWDGKKDSREVLNQDHDAKSWMKEYVVWFSQRLTPKIGKAKFQSYLDRFQYGNRDLSSGITEAWLVSPSEPGGLRISAYDQIEFMKKLWSGKIPASQRSMQIARDLTYLETSPRGFKMHGKTGSGFYDRDQKKNLGWFISHIQNGEQEYLSVVNFSDLQPTDAGYGGPRAKAITRQILADQGLW